MSRPIMIQYYTLLLCFIAPCCLASSVYLSSSSSSCPNGFTATCTSTAGVLEWNDLNAKESVQFTPADSIGESSSVGVFTAVLTNITANSTLISRITANTAQPGVNSRTIECSDAMDNGGVTLTVAINLSLMETSQLAAAECTGSLQAVMAAVNLTWSNPDQCVTGYDVEVNGNASNSTITFSTENQSRVVMLVPGSDCSFRVRALAGHVQGTWSEPLNFTIDAINIPSTSTVSAISSPSSVPPPSPVLPPYPMIPANSSHHTPTATISSILTTSSVPTASVTALPDSNGLDDFSMMIRVSLTLLGLLIVAGILMIILVVKIKGCKRNTPCKSLKMADMKEDESSCEQQQQEIESVLYEVIDEDSMEINTGYNSTLLRDEGFEVYDNIDNDQTQPPPAVSAKQRNHSFTMSSNPAYDSVAVQNITSAPPYCYDTTLSSTQHMVSIPLVSSRDHNTQQ